MDELRGTSVDRVSTGLPPKAPAGAAGSAVSSVPPARAAGAPHASRPRHHRRPAWPLVVEGALLALSPLLAELVFRLAIMSPVELPDPSIHTSYLVDPHQVYARYQAAYASTARLREGARVGFVVPGRIFYELFGSVGGFVAFRYLLALIAVVPAYVLVRRLYQRPAAAMTVVLILSCPVFVRAWGTDYPNSAAISYLTGALACLGLALAARRRRSAWVAAGAALVTLAVWAFLTAAVVALPALVVYVAIRSWQSRRGALGDVGMLAGSAVVTSGVLAVGSYFLIGPLNYITPTWQAYVYLSTPSQQVQWHSTNWHWLPYDTYLLVPVAVLGIGAVAFARWPRRLPPVQSFLVVSTALAAGLMAYLQFFRNVQILEVHFWSSLLWSGTYLVLGLALGELTRRVGDDLLGRWLPVAVVVAVPLVYESRRSVPAFTWSPAGVALTGAVVAVAILARAGTALARPGRSALGLASGVVVTIAAASGLLVLTVAPAVAHAHIPHTVNDPPAAYAATLGVNDALSIDEYRVAAELPHFTGEPAYRGEQLLIWWPIDQFSQMIEPMGIYHAGFNSIPGPWGMLAPVAARKIEQRRPGQVLLMSMTGFELQSCYDALQQFDPRLVRRAVLSSGPVHLHVWLIDLERYTRVEAGRLR